MIYISNMSLAVIQLVVGRSEWDRESSGHKKDKLHNPKILVRVTRRKADMGCCLDRESFPVVV